MGMQGPARPGHLWAALAAALAAGALLLWWAPAALLDWQPQWALTEPWRLWSAAFVHWSPLHLGANLLGTALVAALGVAAAAPTRLAGAWFVAWPLTHLGLLARPELAHYGGLSGVLHAGVAATALWLVCAARGRRRAIGVALLAGLLAKLLTEEPWGAALRHPAGWDIAIAPLAHATGTLAGALCAVVAWARPRPFRR